MCYCCLSKQHEQPIYVYDGLDNDLSADTSINSNFKVNRGVTIGFSAIRCGTTNVTQNFSAATTDDDRTIHVLSRDHHTFQRLHISANHRREREREEREEGGTAGIMALTSRRRSAICLAAIVGLCLSRTNPLKCEAFVTSAPATGGSSTGTTVAHHSSRGCTGTRARPAIRSRGGSTTHVSSVVEDVERSTVGDKAWTNRSPVHEVRKRKDDAHGKMSDFSWIFVNDFPPPEEAVEASSA